MIVVLFLQGLGAATDAEHWPRFHGPNGSGVGEGTGFPAAWAESEFGWKVALPGTGHGSPVVWGDKLFVNAASDDGSQRIVQCRSTAGGELIWQDSFAAPTHKTHRFNSFATSTPAVDEQHVYAAWGTPDELILVAITHDGAIAWQSAGLGGVVGGHGFGASPIVYKDLVVITRENEPEGDSSLIALDRLTGKVAWQIPRPGGRMNFSTPCLYRNPATGADELIFVSWPIGVTSVDPADGKQLWEIEAFQTEKGERAVASPLVAGDLLLTNCAFTNGPKHLVALRATGPGRVEVAWRVDDNSVPHLPSLAAADGLVFALNDAGICITYNLTDGEKLGQRRIGGNFFGSPVCVDGKVYAVDVDGVVVCLKASPDCEELGRTPLNDLCRSTPAVAGGKLFVRTESHLVCLPARNSQ
jgi:outer membrane protein assembly factor BamB